MKEKKPKKPKKPNEAKKPNETQARLIESRLTTLEENARRVLSEFISHLAPFTSPIPLDANPPQPVYRLTVMRDAAINAASLIEVLHEVRQVQNGGGDVHDLLRSRLEQLLSTLRMGLTETRYFRLCATRAVLEVFDQIMET